jgi:hypothetical protein
LHGVLVNPNRKSFEKQKFSTCKLALHLLSMNPLGWQFG